MLDEGWALPALTPGWSFSGKWNGNGCYVILYLAIACYFYKGPVRESVLRLLLVEGRFPRMNRDRYRAELAKSRIVVF